LNWPQALRFGILALSFGFAGLLDACSCGPDAVAQLTEARGGVERDDAAEGVAWHTTAVGETYTWDEAVRTASDATASLVIGGSSGVRMQPGTVIRFSRQPSPRAGGEATGVEVTSGAVELDASGAGVSLVTRAGAVQLPSGTRIRLQAGPAERIEVIAGRVQFDDGVVVEAGRAVIVEVGRVILEDEAPAAVADAGVPAETEAPDAATELPEDPLPQAPLPRAGGLDPSLEDATEPAEANAVGNDAPIVTSPARAHLALTAGESVTVHDTAPPVAIRIDPPGGCGGIVTVTLTSSGRGTRFEGRGNVIVSVPAGRARYAVRCASASPADHERTGVITVRRDDGSLRLESVPPRNVFDADGRRYDVLYQNALPIVTFRWAQAGAGPYQVEVVSGARTRTLTASSSSHVFESGALRDGEHRLVFVAGSRRSPPTTVRVRFDNAAPTAHIREPRGAVSRGSVHVSGMAIDGATVSVGAAQLPLDGDNRFEGDLSTPADLDALAIRFAHPRSGVHYYLRRVSP
jgi:hypothetical protein